MNIQDVAGTTPLDNVTAAIATTAVVSPVWLPWLEYASTAAALFAPILGALWLIVQIGGRIVDIRSKLKENDED